MSGHVIYDGSTVAVMGVQCSTCIFRPGNLMHLQPGRVHEMVASCRADPTGAATIPCHQTLDRPRQAVCRGFNDAHAGVVLRLAWSMGIVAEVELGDLGEPAPAPDPNVS